MAPVSPKNGLQKVLKVAGSPRKLAELLGGISPQAIYQWDEVPVKRVLDVERVTGISRYELRPDIYGPELPKLRNGARA